MGNQLFQQRRHTSLLISQYTLATITLRQLEEPVSKRQGQDQVEQTDLDAMCRLYGQ
jgi:hypothetical protein